jgi:hypothetical protein
MNSTHACSTDAVTSGTGSSWRIDQKSAAESAEIVIVDCARISTLNEEGRHSASIGRLSEFKASSGRLNVFQMWATESNAVNWGRSIGTFDRV